MPDEVLIAVLPSLVQRDGGWAIDWKPVPTSMRAIMAEYAPPACDPMRLKFRIRVAKSE